MKKTTTIIIAVIVIIGLWMLVSYNGLVTARESYTSQWSQVENQYQRRVDLIPNLVSSVQGAMKQEKEVFGALAEARTRYAGASTQTDKVAAANGVESALSRLLVVMENYPQLKSSDTVRDLMTQLEGTENRVSVERQKYNDQIKGYNLRVQRIPGSILAGLFGFDTASYFEATPGSEKAPEVKF